MKIQAEKNTVETFGNVEKTHKTAFRVKQSREMFKLLSSGLYSDKILAVIRELSANAVDAQVEAGTQNKPFEVHLPTMFEPYFHIRDYGNGLSKEDVLNLYTTYGESTKTNSNSVTGCFGVGSKSPFAYTDHFTITSRHEGTKTTYTCSVSEEGYPTVELVSEGSTEDESGLEIHFAVEQKDFKEFVEKAQKNYSYYTQLPTFKGASVEMDELKTETFMEMKDGTIIKDIIEGKAPSGCIVVQGACHYQISRTELRELDGNAQTVLNSLSVVTLTGKVLIVPIGSVNVTASRESIELDKVSKGFFKKTVAEVVDTYRKQVSDQLASAKNWWEAKLICLTVENWMRNILSNVPVYNSETIQQLMERPLKLNLLNFEGKPMGYVDKCAIAEQVNGIRLYTSSINKSSGYAFERQFYNSVGIYGIPVCSKTEEIRIIVDDKVHKNYRQILRHNCAKWDVKQSRWGGSSDNRLRVVLVSPKDSSDVKEIHKRVEKQLGGLDKITIMKLSDLEIPPKKSRVTSVKSRGVYKIKEFDDCPPACGVKSRLKDINKDLSKGGVYVNISSFSPDLFGSLKDLQRFLRTAKKAGFLSDNLTVYAVPASHKTIPEENPNWVHLKDVLKKIHDKRVTKDRQRVIRSAKLAAIQEALMCRQTLIRGCEHVEKTSRLAKKLYLMHLKYTDYRQDIDTKLLKRTYTELSMQLDTDSVIDVDGVRIGIHEKISKAFETFENRYPMLNLLVGATSGFHLNTPSTQQHMNDYVETINKLKGYK